MKASERKRMLSRMARAVCLAACAVMWLLSIPCGAQQERVVRVGSFPYENQLIPREEGTYSGYAFDYLQQIARYTGWRYEFVEATWQESQDMLARGEIDLMGAMLKSPEREARFDFSDLSMLSGYGVLATKLDNQVLPYEDFEAFDGLKVGVIAANEQTLRFLEYAKENGFTPRLRYFATERGLLAGLEAGEVDAIIQTSILRSASLRVVAKFAHRESYFVTTKGNAQLLGELNAAMRQIVYAEPYYNSDLNRKYYELETSTSISFTRPELDYIKSRGVIHCAYNPSEPPISQYDAQTGAVRGIGVDMLSLLEARTGLSFELANHETLDGAMAAFQAGDAEILLASPHDYNWAIQHGAVLTNPYIEGQTVLISGSVPDSEPVIAVYAPELRGELPQEIINGEHALRNYETPKECIDAVQSGEAEAALGNSIVMTYVSGSARYTGTKTIPLYGHSSNICFGVSKGADPALVSILNKALGNISSTEINHILSENTRAPYLSSMLDILYAKPVESVLLVGGVLLVIAAVLLLMFRNRAKNAESMKRLLYLDPVTGFPNSKVLSDDMHRMVASDPKSYALLYMDMRGFKVFNDTYGYDSGDRVLKGISGILHRFVERDERFARLYADKFALLLRYTTQEAFEKRLDALSEMLGELSSGNLENVKFLFSVGIYRLREDLCDFGGACDRANYARDTIHDQYDNTFAYYDDVMRGRVMAEKSLESSMNPALERGEFVPYYQPKVDVLTGDVVGAEALVRWERRDGATFSPGQFLPFYERNGFIVRIDFSIFEQACRHLRYLMDAGERVVPVSVNFSRLHMQDKQFAKKLRGIADRYEIPAHMLEVEITETLDLENMDAPVEFARAVKAQGFSISIDDFGTGYSSISLLESLPLDTLKFDKSFLESAMQAPKARDIMRHLICAIQANDIRVLCEGIEKAEQRDFILSMGCRLAQGYFYSKPLHWDDFRDYLRHKSAPDAANLN